MKPTAFVLGLGSLALVATASADQTINITGATAFRSAVLNSLKKKFASASSPSFKYGSDNATLTSSNRSIFVGNFPTLSGTTTIRCCFTGSVEGIRAVGGLADPAPPTYIPTNNAIIAAASPSAGGTETAVITDVGATDVSDIAFSDVNKTSTPYGSAAVTSDPVGVIVFAMVSNKGSVINNVTSQQFRALMAGPQYLQLFTGNPNDQTPVVGTGRNDLSGTRTTYLAETGYGITKPAHQYLITASGGAITKLQEFAAGGSTASTVWGQDVIGNGGYTSGGTIATALGNTANSAQITDSTGGELFAAGHADVVTWLGVGDAGVAKFNGANVCAFNGVSLNMSTVVFGSSSTAATAITAGKVCKIVTAGTTDYTAIGAANNTVGTIFTATGAGTGTGTVNLQSGFTLSSADQNLIYNGSYTAWGYERMFKKSSPSAGAAAVYTQLKGTSSSDANAIPANLGTAGVKVSDMVASRQSDGGVVTVY